ncbi:MAG: HigA family addiction module antidote protein [Cyanobacteria bacterium]|nr:HigA family addiction module antidote protein [Cyanobacteriota bacterium]
MWINGRLKRRPSHPGVVLASGFIKPLKISQAEFARYIGWTPVRLNCLVKGKRDITPENALTLADALGTTAEYWMGLQTKWDLWYARLGHKPLELHPNSQEPRKDIRSRVVKECIALLNNGTLNDKLNMIHLIIFCLKDYSSDWPPELVDFLMRDFGLLVDNGITGFELKETGRNIPIVEKPLLFNLKRSKGRPNKNQENLPIYWEVIDHLSNEKSLQTSFGEVSTKRGVDFKTIQKIYYRFSKANSETQANSYLSFPSDPL